MIGVIIITTLVQQNNGSTEDSRRGQIIDAAIDTIADLGYVGATLAQIATRGGVSAALISHYFQDKNGLMEAVFRKLVQRVSRGVVVRQGRAQTPRARIQAVIDANLAPQEFDSRTAIAWLAFWGQVIHIPQFRRIQVVYQSRILSNLRHALRPLVPAHEVPETAAMIAAMIDGVWLRATLSDWSETNSDSARLMVSHLVDMTLAAAQGKMQILQRATGQVQKNFINGGFINAAGGETFETRNPATGAVLSTVEIAGAPEIEQAVAAARAGQRIWARMTGAQRGRVLNEAARLLRAKNSELALLETLDTGKPIQETSVVDVASGADCLEYFAGIASGLAGEQVDLGPAAFGYTRREPLGIVAGIGAWNYPLQIACWKAAPALACGNAMIFKPAEMTPLTALRLAEIFKEAGLPDGVFNVVQGFAATGRMLTQHPGIHKISLTGEVGTGRAVMADAAASLKHVTLELGGKSPLLVFEDADLDNAVSGALLANFYSAGEVCSNGTRVFVHEQVRDEFLRRLKLRTEAMRVGDPLDPATQVGALISPAHMNKVLSYIEAGKAEGAALVTGGARALAGALAQGCFVQPTIFADCHDEMKIVREEIFGPVMCVLSFRDENEVVARANATRFGLSAGVFTQDLTRAHRVIANLEAGTCWINHFNVTPIELPFGGVKQSGLGRENGKAAIEHYTQIKSVYVALEKIDAPY